MLLHPTKFIWFFCFRYALSLCCISGVISKADKAKGFAVVRMSAAMPIALTVRMYKRLVQQARSGAKAIIHLFIGISFDRTSSQGQFFACLYPAASAAAALENGTRFLTA